MGAMVGGMLAAGKLEEFTGWVTGLGRFEMVRMLDLSLSGAGAIRGERLFSVVGELLGGAVIEDLPVAFTAVAVDLVSRREVWFQEGPLDVAIRASSAIPSFFAPVELNGRLLVDGAVLDPVPVAAVAAVHADMVIAVSLDGQGSATSAPVSESAGETSEEEWSERMRGAAARWFDSEMLSAVRRRMNPDTAEAWRRRLAAGPPEPDEPSLGTVDVVQASYEIMQGALTRHRLAGFAPDHMVTLPRNACRTLDFHRATEMIEVGRQIATQQLAELLTAPAGSGQFGAASG